MIQLFKGDCLIESDKIESGSVDLILTDLPYGTVTNIGNSETIKHGMSGKCDWDIVIDIYNIDKMQGFKEFSELKEIDDKYSSIFNLWEGKKYKSNILKYKKDYDGHHPTQKPVLLLEDLIKTFSNEGDLIVDLTMGSGSCGVACKNTNRNFIGIEMDENYFEIAEKRINEI